MKSQLEEMRRKIIEVLVKRGFPVDGVKIYPPKKIIVKSKRDDMPEGIDMILRLLSDQRWGITMSDDDERFRGPLPSKDEEEVLEFIDKSCKNLSNVVDEIFPAQQVNRNIK